ncbi:diadenylate cyclase [Lactobacillus colini]|uniref:Diadenylate cyclase n=2 Tax=Lactobacillus colini TaxID=1819254 RepID=A0ABS4MEC3_9LACO|nr:diadenylate cyclase [Lactobacillus colini]
MNININPSQIFTWQNLMNVLDILIVWYIIYRLIMLVKGTKAVQLVKGISLIVLIRIIAGFLNLHTLTYFVDQVLSWSVIGIIVIFQPEIRRGLEHLGRSPIFGGSTGGAKKNSEHMVHELDKAIQYMSKRRIGALITLQQSTGLDDYIETGIPLDADISGELLINIFIPNTPLHDGAVIISDNKIAVASAYLPLSDNTMIPKKLGTRHRAAVGISEVTDAITIVVSEETGGVTITRNSQFMLDLTREEYMKYLTAQLVPAEKEKPKWYQRMLNKIWNWGSNDK